MSLRPINILINWIDILNRHKCDLRFHSLIFLPNQYITKLIIRLYQKFLPLSNSGQIVIQAANGNFTPTVTNDDVIKFLTYKAVVDKDATVDSLMNSLTSKEGYSVRVVYKNGEDVPGDALMKTGMWILIINDMDGVAVESYYVEIGNPKNTAGVKDVFMEGSPGQNGESPNSGDNKTDLWIILTVIASAAVVKSLYKKAAVNKN